MTKIPAARWLLSATLLIGLAPIGAWAQTRDGMTPAEEDVCDVLVDASPGLYGLCVAYCEAQDCDSLELAISGQCRAPNPRLLDHYERKRGPEDPPMPCLAPAEQACPCFTRDDLATMPVDDCIEMDYSDANVLVLTDEDDINGAIVEVGADGWGSCGVFSGPGTSVEIDPDEVQACQLLIHQRAEALGLACDPTQPL